MVGITIRVDALAITERVSGGTPLPGEGRTDTAEREDHRGAGLAGQSPTQDRVIEAAAMVQRQPAGQLQYAVKRLGRGGFGISAG